MMKNNAAEPGKTSKQKQVVILEYHQKYSKYSVTFYDHLCVKDMKIFELRQTIEEKVDGVQCFSMGNNR